MFVLMATLLAAAQTRPSQRSPRTRVPAKAAEVTAASTKAAEDALKKLEQQWLDALVGRDRNAVDQILAPDFRDIGIDGRERTREQALAAVTDDTRPAFQRMFGRLDARVYDGKFGVVTGLTIIMGEKIREAHVSFTDVFVLRDGRWQAVSAQETLGSD